MKCFHLLYKETNYKDEKLVIDDFIYQFIPREVELKFKNNETFQKMNGNEIS
jgi:hypothetical protein